MLMLASMVAGFAVALLVLWFLFINVMYLKARIDKLHMILKILAYTFGGFAFLYDVLDRKSVV